MMTTALELRDLFHKTLSICKLNLFEKNLPYFIWKNLWGLNEEVNWKLGGSIDFK